MNIKISDQPLYLTRLNDIIHIFEDTQKRYLIQLDLNGKEIQMAEWGYNKPSDVIKIITDRFSGAEMLKTSIVVNVIKNLETCKLIGYANSALKYMITRIKCDRIKTYKILDCQ